MSTSQVVLGIPVPQCVQQLRRSPPICFPRQGDLAAIDLLKAFGMALGKSKHEITQACNLVSGSSDVAIILERPHKKSYNKSFEQNVKDSPTLQAVDDLIQFVTKGSRSIHTVTVLDAFSYQPDENVRGLDERCHQLLGQILHAKKPKVVIHCYWGEYKDKWMKQFKMAEDGYKLGRKEIEDGGGHKIILFQSFHPSCAVNNDDLRPEFRALLIHHFLAAFGELSGRPWKMPDYVERIRELCQRKVQPRDKSKLDPWKAAHFIHRALQAGYGSPEDNCPVTAGVWANLQDQATAFDAMYQGLGRLARKSCNCGALSIANIVLLYWGWHVKPGNEPLHNQIKSVLCQGGNEQFGWFPSPANKDEPTTEASLKEQLSHLHLSNLPERLQRVLVLDSRDTRMVSRAATPLPDNYSREELTSSIRELEEFAYEHHTDMKQALRLSSVTDFASTVRTAAFDKRLDAFSVLMKSKRGILEDENADHKLFAAAWKVVLQGVQPPHGLGDNCVEIVAEPVPLFRPRTPQRSNRNNQGLLTPEITGKKLATGGMSSGGGMSKRSHRESAGSPLGTPTKKSKSSLKTLEAPAPLSLDSSKIQGHKQNLILFAPGDSHARAKSRACEAAADAITVNYAALSEEGKRRLWNLTSSDDSYV